MASTPGGFAGVSNTWNPTPEKPQSTPPPTNPLPVKSQTQPGDFAGVANTAQNSERVWSHMLERWFTGSTWAEADRSRKANEAYYVDQQQTKAAKGQMNLVSGVLSDPTTVVTKADPVGVTTHEDQFVSPSVGVLGKGINPVEPNTAPTSTASVPREAKAKMAVFDKSLNLLEDKLGNTSAARGTVSPNAVADAISKDPKTLARLGIEAAQIQQPVTVNAPDPRTLNPAEMVTGSAVNWAKVEEKAQVDAATANPSKKATVAGQLEDLMAQFEGGNTPAWAAGSMRKAMATLQDRGLGASSLAGQAVIQAAMEAAVPIAMADAQTYAQFESQNLSNKQQAAILSAQQRAAFLNMDFTQEFQSRVSNAAKISDIANMNFTAEQQVALENANLAQTVDLNNLSAKNAKILADAAAMSQMDMANLSNAQMVAVENAKAFLTMDMTNLSNEQETAIFKQQAINNQILSDQAAHNAAVQLNAENETKVSMYMANLHSMTSQFNAAQKNALAQFNVNEVNSVRKFNNEIENMRQQFEANMGLEIAQSNAKWRQNVAIFGATAQNESNLEMAKSANSMTQQALDNLWMRERDLMSYAFQAAENYEDRNLQLILADKQLDAQATQRRTEGIGYLVGSLLFGGF